MKANKSLRVLAVLSLVLPFGILIISAWWSYNAAFRNTRERIEQTTAVVREHAIKVFETRQLVTQQVNQVLEGLSDEAILSDQRNLHMKLDALSKGLPQIEDVWVLDRDAHPLLSAHSYPVARNLDLSDRSYFRAHRQGEPMESGVYVSEVLQGRTRKGIFVQFSVARNLGKQFAGIVAVSVDPDYFHAFYKTVAATGVDTVTMVRSDGVVLARYPSTLEQLPQLPRARTLIDAARAAPERGVFEGPSAVDGVDRLVAYEKLPGVPIYVAVGRNRSAVLALWWGYLWPQLAFGLPAMAGLFGLSLVSLSFTRQQARTMAQLQEEIRLREETEARARQMQKMEAVGHLTGGVAHDFNNLLTIILGSLDLMRRHLARGEADVMRFVDMASEGANRAAVLTQRLLAFARKQPLEPKPVDVNRLVLQMSELLRRTLGEQIEVETVLAGGMWPAHVDVNQLENAILNLAVNARDAMPEGGKLTIETANSHLDEAYVAPLPEMSPGQYALICVSDTGVGMTPDVIARAFDPFFTTKADGQGTGLGLSQVYGFVKQSGGHVGIYSEPGHGTTVKLYLPRFLGAAFPDMARPPRAPKAGSESVLLVEDEPTVRQFSHQALEELGYRVFSAENAQSALETLDKHQDIALLLTDIVMPGMNGKKLAEEAARRRPDLKVLYTTGYSRNAIIHNGVLDHGVALLNKPFTLAQLATKVRQVLDS